LDTALLFGSGNIGNGKMFSQIAINAKSPARAEDRILARLVTPLRKYSPERRYMDASTEPPSGLAILLTVDRPVSPLFQLSSKTKKKREGLGSQRGVELFFLKNGLTLFC
jgi:hypothetical protein